MAIKDFRFLRNDRGLKKENPLSSVTYRDVATPIHQKMDKIEVQRDFGTTERRNNDIVDLTDTAAITNALVTIFSTRKGARPLVPRMGMDLREYIGEPLTEDAIYILEEDITKEIEEYEPRVRVQKVEITSDADNNELHVKLKCAFPNLPGDLKDIFVTLKSNGDVFTGIS